MNEDEKSTGGSEPTIEPGGESAANPAAAENASAASATALTAADERIASNRADRRRRRRAIIAGGAGLALLTALVAGGAGIATATDRASASNSASSAIVDGATGQTIIALPYGSAFGGGSGSTSGYGSGYGSGSDASGYGGYGTYGGGSTNDSTTTATDAVAATDAQKVGVVTITSTLTYENAESMGTGIILTSDGMILTNNHVVAGATSIEVTDESTGQTYTARVVGTDATNDVAVLQLVDAAGLVPATLATGDVAEGDAVTAVGNAGGTGDLVAASGTVTATEQTITTQAEGAAEGETLDGLIQVDADIVSGDSGGPLFNAAGQVVGINTAASSGTADIVGFTIPISDALDIVAQIEAGADTATVSIGYPAFLGVELATTGTGSSSAAGGYGSSTGAGSGYGSAAGAASGATIAGVIDGTPAADAGLAAGDTITAVNGTGVASSSELSAALAEMEPGESVTLTWTDASGATQTATVTLVEGPVA